LKKIFVGLLILSIFIPVVYADQLYPLLRTRTRLRSRTEGTSVKETIIITAPFKRGCTPGRAIKWTLYKKDVYNRYQWKKTGYLSGIKYYCILTWSGLQWKARMTKYFFALNPGDYKFKLTSYDGCFYKAVKGTNYFTITGK
jgi:hypothetical protein